MSGWHSLKNLKELGVKVLGSNVKVSTLCRIYNPTQVILHDNIRIDDFTIISAKDRVEIGNFVHIAAHNFISSSCGIFLDDFTNIAAGCKLYGANDDYSGNHLIGPTIPEGYTKVDKGAIHLKKYSILGANSIVMPNVTIDEGSVLGTFSMATKNTEPWSIYVGVPMRKIKERSRNCVDLSKSLLSHCI